MSNMLGSDVDGLDKIGSLCDTAAGVADEIKTIMQGIVAALRALEWFTGPWAEGLIEVLTTTVIPFLQRAAAMLRAAAKVLHLKAASQRKVSQGVATQISVTVTYRSLMPPASAWGTAAAAIASTANATTTTTTFAVPAASAAANANPTIRLPNGMTVTVAPAPASAPAMSPTLAPAPAMSAQIPGLSATMSPAPAMSAQIPGLSATMSPAPAMSAQIPGLSTPMSPAPAMSTQIPGLSTPIPAPSSATMGVPAPPMSSLTSSIPMQPGALGGGMPTVTATETPNGLTVTVSPAGMDPSGSPSYATVSPAGMPPTGSQSYLMTPVTGSSTLDPNAFVPTAGHDLSTPIGTTSTLGTNHDALSSALPTGGGSSGGGPSGGGGGYPSSPVLGSTAGHDPLAASAPQAATDAAKPPAASSNTSTLAAFGMAGLGAGLLGAGGGYAASKAGAKDKYDGSEHLTLPAEREERRTNEV
jgi:hypothetical protein